MYKRQNCGTCQWCGNQYRLPHHDPRTSACITKLTAYQKKRRTNADVGLADLRLRASTVARAVSCMPKTWLFERVVSRQGQQQVVRVRLPFGSGVRRLPANLIPNRVQHFAGKVEKRSNRQRAPQAGAKLEVQGRRRTHADAVDAGLCLGAEAIARLVCCMAKAKMSVVTHRYIDTGLTCSARCQRLGSESQQHNISTGQKQGVGWETHERRRR